MVKIEKSNAYKLIKKVDKFNEKERDYFAKTNGYDLEFCEKGHSKIGNMLGNGYICRFEDEEEGRVFYLSEEHDLKLFKGIAKDWEESTGEEVTIIVE